MQESHTLANMGQFKHSYFADVHKEMGHRFTLISTDLTKNHRKSVCICENLCPILGMVHK